MRAKPTWSNTSLICPFRPYASWSSMLMWSRSYASNAFVDCKSRASRKMCCILLSRALVAPLAACWVCSPWVHVCVPWGGEQ
eukprot:1809596-Amphidinium_carterae.1